MTRFRPNSPWKRLCLAGALALATPAARAEDTPQAPSQAAPKEAADKPKSQVTGIALGEAHLVTDTAVVEKLSAQLLGLAGQAGLPLGAPEVLAWGDVQKGYAPEQAKGLMAQVTMELDKGGWKLEAAGEPQQGPQSRVSLFTGASDAQQKMLMGYWVESDAMLVLVWAPLLLPTVEDTPAPAPPAAPK